MKVVIVGAGYVGLVTGLGLAKLGHQIWFLDIDEKKISLLKKGKLPFREPGLTKLLKEARRENKVYFSSSYRETVPQGEGWLICVGTPSAADGSCNLDFVLGAVREVIRWAPEKGFLVIKSTVDPLRVGEIEELVGERLRLSFVPEFLSEGRAVKDFFSPFRLVFGVKDEVSLSWLKRLYRKIKGERIICSPYEAVLIKCVSNIFLATKISFVNLWALFCGRVGADINQVIKGVGLDPRIGDKFLAAGLGFGGSCFPKDLRAACVYFSQVGIRNCFLKEVLQINQMMVEWVVEKIKKWQKKKIAVWGATFKPHTDDLRESQALVLVERLSQLKLREIRVCDPAADPEQLRRYPKVKFFRDPYQSVEGMEVIVLATEWEIFGQVDFKKVASLMEEKTLIDGRVGFKLWDKERLIRLGFDYWAIGEEKKMCYTDKNEQ